MFFDLNIKGAGLENNIALASEASRYGWEHINFSYNQNEFKVEIVKVGDTLCVLEKIQKNI